MGGTDWGSGYRLGGGGSSGGLGMAARVWAWLAEFHKRRHADSDIVLYASPQTSAPAPVSSPDQTYLNPWQSDFFTLWVWALFFCVLLLLVLSRE